MKKKLETRKSAQFLLTLEGAGRLDSRSEIGTIINLTEWKQRPSVKFHCKCEEVRDTEELIPSYLILTDAHLYILRHTDEKNKMVVKARRVLKRVMKITTKAKLKDVVKIQYGTKGEDKIVHITDSDKLHIPGKSAEVILNIKKCLEKADQRPEVDSLAVPASHLMSRRPSMIAEDGKHFFALQGDDSSGQIRKASSSTLCQEKTTTTTSESAEEAVDAERQLSALAIDTFPRQGEERPPSRKIVKTRRSTAPLRFKRV